MPELTPNERRKLLKHAYTPPRTVAISKHSQRLIVRYNNKVITEALTGKRENYKRILIRLKTPSYQIEMVSEWKQKRTIRVIVSYSRGHKNKIITLARQEAIIHARALLGSGSWTLVKIISEVWRHYVSE